MHTGGRIGMAGAVTEPVLKRRLGVRVRFLAVVAAASFMCVFGVWLLAHLLVRAEPYLKSTPRDFHHSKPLVGEPVPDFSLPDVEGNLFRLSEQIKRRPMVIGFGSLT